MSKKTSNKLNDVQIFYIEGNCLKMSLEEIAKKLDVKEETIKDIYEKNKKQKGLSFQTYSGTVAMTASQSSSDDEKSRTNQNEAFMNKYKNNIHKI